MLVLADILGIQVSLECPEVLPQAAFQGLVVIREKVDIRVEREVMGQVVSQVNRVAFRKQIPISSDRLGSVCGR